MMLSLPTVPVLEKLSGHKVVDCGAGAGLWVRIMREFDIDAIGIDPNPRSDYVLIGSHDCLVEYSDRLLLIVWPPDGTILQDWVDVWGGDWLAICGKTSRFEMPQIESVWSTTLEACHKGPSSFVLGRNSNYQREE